MEMIKGTRSFSYADGDVTLNITVSMVNAEQTVDEATRLIRIFEAATRDISRLIEEVKEGSEKFIVQSEENEKPKIETTEAGKE